MVTIDVITYASGYSYGVYERFVGSLRKTGFDGIIHLIVGQQDFDHVIKLQETYSSIWVYVDNLKNENNTHINNHRFFALKQYLNCVQLQCDYVFFCDARDVLFQKNMSEYEIDTSVDIYGFLEGICIQNDLNCNSRWIKQLDLIMNERIYEPLSTKRVICCGTTLAKKEAFVRYVSAMCFYISNYNIKENLDQGLHNYMLHLNKLSNLNVRLLSNLDNLVNTVGCDLHKVNDDGRIVNRNDQVSFIVHQYDRFCPEYKQRVSAELGYDFTF